jgi:hypothetical protein
MHCPVWNVAFQQTLLHFYLPDLSAFNNMLQNKTRCIQLNCQGIIHFHQQQRRGFHGARLAIVTMRPAANGLAKWQGQHLVNWKFIGNGADGGC